MRGYFTAAAVLVAILALPAMAGEEAGTPTGEAATPVMPARGEVREVEPGHWVAHLRDEKFIDLIAPEGNKRSWTVVGPDGKPQSVEERPEPGAPEGVRRFQVPFQYVEADGGEVSVLVTGTIVESARGLVRVIDVFDIPEQRVRVVRVEVPGPERVVTKKKKKTEWWPILLAGGLVYALTSGGGDGGGTPTPDNRLAKYCPYWRDHVAADHAAGRNTSREDYTFRADTWAEVDKLLQEHLRICPFALAEGGFDPQDGGPGVGDSLIQAHRVGGLEMGIPLGRRTRLTAITGDLALVRRERGFSLSLHQDGSWGIGTDKLRFTAGAEKNFEIAASAKWRTSGVNLRLSNFGGSWMGGISLQKAF